MAKFKITKSTTVAELKEQFSSEFGGVLRVYEGRSEAPEDAALVSLGAKEGDLECRASRTVGKFEEAFQSELGLKVKVYTKDNWVSVLDGITLSTVRAIPKSATKAKMEQFLAYQRDEKEDVAEEVEIPEEIKGIPLFDIHMKKVEWPFMTEEEIDEHSDELGDCGVVIVSGDNEDGEFQYFVFAGDTDDGMYNALEFIEWGKDEYGLENFEAQISDFIKIYGLDKKDYELEGDIQQGLIAQTGCEYCCGEWKLDTPALFRINFNAESQTVFLINARGNFDKEYDNNVFEKLVELTESGKNEPKEKVFDPDDYYFCEDLARVEKDGKYGFIDTNGNLVVDYIYDRARHFSNGFAVVDKDWKNGFIDTKGNLVVDCIYDNASDFSDGFALVEKDGKYGFIDTKGNLAIDCIYDDAFDFSEGFAKVEKDGKYGYIDTKGNIVIDCIYDRAGNFYDGITKVEKDGKSFKIDTKGNVVE